MKFKFFILSGLCFLFISNSLYAQDKLPIKFGRVSVEDFDITKLNVDTTEGAVVIADVGISSFEGNTKGYFTLVFKHQRRVKIINKNGFDLANVEIPLYVQGNKEESLEKISAITYNLENGKVVETKLDMKSVFKDKYDKNHVVKKFTLPQVKEGCIIEYSYTINSDYLFNLHAWNFQGSYPRVWSEYTTKVPEFFEYVFLSQGYHPFFKKNNKSYHGDYYVTVDYNGAYGSPDHLKLSGTETENTWIMKDVPALKEEKYTSSIKNHIARIEFQMSGYKFPNQPPKKVMGDWITVSDELMQSDDFGAKINKENNWLDDDIKLIMSGALTKIDKARKIYEYVKKQIKSTGDRGILLSKPLKDVFSSKSGSVAEINVLLIAMLKHENLYAAPVILSTTDHGYINNIYPLLDRFNYVVCKLDIDSTNYFLDASKTKIGFGHLPLFCYNGDARVIDKIPLAINFSPDTLAEAKYTNIMLFNDQKVKGKWEGNLSSNLGYYESYDIRDEIAQHGIGQFEKELSSSYAENFVARDIKLENLDDCEKTINLKYNLTIDNSGNADVIYFNPMLKEGYTENYFKSAERKYPVEMPYLTDETVALYLDIPEGYVVDEVPAPTKVTFNGEEGYFEYLISVGESSINLRSRIKLEKATFYPEEYEALRSFFDYIVKKQSEQIVFKLKK
ncbi:DUF3858 domain-containing protein [Ferruginibacter sp. SUN002]|uniref:DUF3858 domain-containing protein n=1 Tax=Ferruginibacter sp. SUN002 TaxID=2937789 RepID=UPI003D366B49